MLFKNLSRKVLDKGEVALVECMGSDEVILQSARVSTGRGSVDPEKDKALLFYLLRNDHTSPFEMAEFRFLVKAPIFVARQWVRHRTASWNEESGRYKKLRQEFHSPNEFRVQSATNKQASDLPDPGMFDNFKLGEQVADFQYKSLIHFKSMIDAGVAREQARINQPLSIYTSWIWKMDLHNLMHFLYLRDDDHAQKEIRVYAEAIESLLIESGVIPMTLSAYKAVTSLRKALRDAMNKYKNSPLELLDKLKDI